MDRAVPRLKLCSPLFLGLLEVNSGAPFSGFALSASLNFCVTAIHSQCLFPLGQLVSTSSDALTLHFQIQDGNIRTDLQWADQSLMALWMDIVARMYIITIKGIVIWVMILLTEKML